MFHLLRDQRYNIFKFLCFLDGVNFIILYLTNMDQKGAISTSSPEIPLLERIELLQRIFFPPPSPPPKKKKKSAVKLVFVCEVVHPHVCMLKPEINVTCLPLSLSPSPASEMGSLIEAVCCFSRPVSHQPHQICLSPSTGITDSQPYPLLSGCWRPNLRSLCL